jgi:alpha-tubulin suppressor-like RCC1 family protein
MNRSSSLMGDGGAVLTTNSRGVTGGASAIRAMPSAMPKTRFACSAALALVVACGGSKSSPEAPSGGGDTGGSLPPPTGTISTVVTGDYLSCSLDRGAVRCWGTLGDNTGDTDVLSPAPVATDVQFAQLSAYGRTVCGVSTDGAGYCWGPNTDGQLGNGGADAGSKTPVKLKGTITFASIAAGDPTSCGVATDGTGYCWGDNGYGAVGNGDASTTDLLEPTPIAGGLKWKSISVGGVFACGLATDDAVYCWGSNTYGQLGTGKSITGTTTDLSKVPSKVVGNQTWKAITTGQYFACGLTAAGAAMCWGRNDYQLGNGKQEPSSTPVAVSGGATFTKIDSGRDFTCAIAGGGVAHCWGANVAGQMGAGPDAESLSRVPLPVVGNLVFADISASSLEHACGVTADQVSVYCWGRNDHGQLGNGTSTQSNTKPTPSPVKAAL